ncbi:hypothetical protein KEM56_004165, partial [Ascosphaera pollenicola]
MFWRFGGYSSISAIDTLLDKPDVTLEEVLDESELMSELKQNNSKLVEYLREEHILKRLLDYVVSPSLLRVKAEDEEEDESDGDDAENNGKDESTSLRRNRSFEKRKDDATGKTAADEDEEEEEDHQNQDDADLDVAEKARLRYAYIACEILSSNTWPIIESLLQHEQYLSGFWQFLSRPAPLDSLQSGYFTKVNEALLECRTADMLAFFRSMEGIVKQML